jgi:hypothetical protein
MPLKSTATTKTEPKRGRSVCKDTRKNKTYKTDIVKEKITVQAGSKSVCALALNTADLAFEVNNRLNYLGMSITSLSKILNISRAYMGNLINFPEPWQFLRNSKKNHYRALSAWLIQTKNSSSCPVKSDKRMKRRQPRLPVRGLNTARVAKQVMKFVAKYEIPLAHLAKRKFLLTLPYFEQLMRRPRPWAKLLDSEKQLYYRMDKWTKSATQTEVDEFKKLALLLKAKHFINNQIRIDRVKLVKAMDAKSRTAESDHF